MRIRAYSLQQQQRLIALLSGHGIVARGGTERHGPFVVVEHARAAQFSEALATRDVITDARGPWLRLCPDIVTTDRELVRAAAMLAEVAAT